MKILHVILDGYSPSNTSQGVDPEMDIVEKISSRLKAKGYDKSIERFKEVEGVYKLMSPRMWCKLYSKESTDDLVKYNPRVNQVPTDKRYREFINQENLIWNKIINNNDDVEVTTFLPYGAMQLKYDRGVTAMATSTEKRSRTKFIVSEDIAFADDIQHLVYNSPDISGFYGLHEICDDLYLVPEVNEKLNDLWSDIKSMSSESKSISAKLVSELAHDAIVNDYKDRLDSNREIGKLSMEYFHNSLKSRNNKRYDLVGIIENDAIMHTCVPYNDILEHYRDYVYDRINNYLEHQEYDIILFIGDHGMKPASEDKKTYVEFENYDGRKITGEKSAYNNNIYFNDHNNHIGFKAFFRNEEVQDTFIETCMMVESDKKYNYLCDTVYDVIIKLLK